MKDKKLEIQIDNEKIKMVVDKKDFVIDSVRLVLIYTKMAAVLIYYWFFVDINILVVDLVTSYVARYNLTF